MGVDLAGLRDHFQSYDVYVYLDDDQGSRSRSVQSITDGNTTYYLEDNGSTFTGNYVQVTSTNPNAPVVGNYVVFSGLTSDNVSIRIKNDTTASGNSLNTPPITAVQVLGQRYPIDRAETTDPEFGGADHIITGGGPDLVLGGSGADIIETFGPDVLGQSDTDVVVGDNGQATIVLGEVRQIVTTDFESPQGVTPSGASDDDMIVTGNGQDLVLGGNGSDTINTGVGESFDQGDVTILSLNFAGDVANGQITGVAGAVAADDWNNLPSGDPFASAPQTSAGLVFAGGGAAAQIEVEWGQVSTAPPNPRGGSAEPGKIKAKTDVHLDFDGDTQNERLYRGYHYADYGTTVGVDITGLSSHFTSYDVYVYIGADDVEIDSVPRISDGSTTYHLDDQDGNTFRGQFVEADSTDPLAPEAGNYVVFRDVTGDSFSLRIDADPNSPSTTTSRSAISGLQIVGGPDKDAVVLGGDFDKDIVVGDNGVTRLIGGQVYELMTTGHSLVDEGVQADSIQGGDQADLLVGGNGADHILGEEGADVLLGDNVRVLLRDGVVMNLPPAPAVRDVGSVDRFDAFSVVGIQLSSDSTGGADTLDGGRDNDVAYGQFGDDTYVFAGGGLGDDRLAEKGDDDGPFNDLHDRLDFSLFAGPVAINLGQDTWQIVNGGRSQTAKNLDLTLSSESGFEHVTGSQFNDAITGNHRNNMLVGLGGSDVLGGASGRDVLFGGRGVDTLRGGDDEDLLFGGFTNYDEDALALKRIIEEWSSGRDFQARIDNLSNGTGPILGGTGVRLSASAAGGTVFDDDDNADDLDGENGRDWYFASLIEEEPTSGGGRRR